MTKYGLSSRKRPPRLDILGGRLRDVRLYRDIVGRNMLCAFGHFVAMFCNMMVVVANRISVQPWRSIMARTWRL